MAPVHKTRSHSTKMAVVKAAKAFVQFINHSDTKYCMTIGVPYGTSYWQVGDSVEQNGCFKMATYRAKDELLQHRENSINGIMGILPSDIIIIVNQAWEQSFARVRTNKKAIAERGWFPYNRNVLLHPDIRATMTEQEMKDEMGTITNLCHDSHQNIITTVTPDPEAQYISRSSINNPVRLNFGAGMGLHVLKTIVTETDKVTARALKEGYW